MKTNRALTMDLLYLLDRFEDAFEVCSKIFELSGMYSRVSPSCYQRIYDTKDGIKRYRLLLGANPVRTKKQRMGIIKEIKRIKGMIYGMECFLGIFMSSTGRNIVT